MSGLASHGNAQVAHTVKLPRDLIDAELAGDHHRLAQLTTSDQDSQLMLTLVANQPE